MQETTMITGSDFTVIISTIAQWPKLKGPLDFLAPQILASGARCIVACPHPEALPQDQQRELFGSYPGVEVICVEGAHNFTLRRLAVQAVQTKYFILLEDHNFVSPSFIERHVEVARLHREAQAIVPSVRNGTTRTVLERAMFYHTFGIYQAYPFLESARRVPNIAGTAYRTSAIESNSLSDGQLEIDINGQMYDSGQTLFDPDNYMIHHQSPNLAEICRNNFSNGRACFAYKRRFMSAMEQLKWTILALLLAPAATVRWLSPPRFLLLKQERGFHCLGALFVINALFGVGVLFGLYLGPGNSAHNLE